MRKDPLDPKNLIRDSFQIEGISEPECRSIFLDWALSLRDIEAYRSAINEMVSRHVATAPADHPMLKVLREGLAEGPQKRRRGGRAARVTTH